MRVWRSWAAAASWAAAVSADRAAAAVLSAAAFVPAGVATTAFGPASATESAIHSTSTERPAESA